MILMKKILLIIDENNVELEVVKTYETYERYIELYQSLVLNDFVHQDYDVKIMNQLKLAYYRRVT
jgi:hypothetical protein